MLAKHTTTPEKVIVQLTTVWEAWHLPNHSEDLQPQDRQRVTVLYISRNTRTPDAPGNEPQLRRRQRDAALVAWERANSLHDRRQTAWHQLIFKHAAQRLAKIYEDKTHYIHEKAPRRQGKRKKHHKKDLVQQGLEPLPLQPWQGLSVTLDAAPTSGDKRAQAWVFALCIHSSLSARCSAKGTITGMGPQTKARALFQGLLTLAQFVMTPITIVQLASGKPGPIHARGKVSRTSHLTSDHSALHQQEPADARCTRQ